MDFAILPPEINSGRMYAGPGSGPMLAAAAARDGLASELGSAAASFSSVASGPTASRRPLPLSHPDITGPGASGDRAARGEQFCSQCRSECVVYRLEQHARG